MTTTKKNCLLLLWQCYWPPFMISFPTFAVISPLSSISLSFAPQTSFFLLMAIFGFSCHNASWKRWGWYSLLRSVKLVSIINLHSQQSNSTGFLTHCHQLQHSWEMKQTRKVIISEEKEESCWGNTINLKKRANPIRLILYSMKSSAG